MTKLCPFLKRPCMEHECMMYRVGPSPNDVKNEKYWETIHKLPGYCGLVYDPRI